MSGKILCSRAPVPFHSHFLPFYHSLPFLFHLFFSNSLLLFSQSLSLFYFLPLSISSIFSHLTIPLSLSYLFISLFAPIVTSSVSFPECEPQAFISRALHCPHDAHVKSSLDSWASRKIISKLVENWFHSFNCLLQIIFVKICFLIFLLIISWNVESINTL